MNDSDEQRVNRIAADIVTEQGRRRRHARWATGVAALGVLGLVVPISLTLARPHGSGHPATAAGGNARSSSDVLSKTGTTARPAHLPIRTSTSMQDTARIYAALLTGRSAGPTGHAAVGRIYVGSSFCAGMMGMEQHQRGPCRAGPIPLALQSAIFRLTGPAVRFTARPPQPGKGVTVLHVGTATVRGDRAEVALDMSCGPLCGQGDTTVLRRHGDGWLITGAAGGYAWIS